MTNPGVPMHDSSDNQYLQLLESKVSPEKFVRRALQMFEADFRMAALLALADWEKLGIVSQDLFQAVASLQRPSWGMWNGLLTGLKKARNNALRKASDEVREQIESAETLKTVLAQAELRLDSDTAQSLKPLGKLTRTSMPKKLRLNTVLTMPISLRNRIAHDAPSATEWWDESKEAILPLVEFHAYLNPLHLLLSEIKEFPSPWFVASDEATSSESQSLAACSWDEDDPPLVFNGLANDQSVIYVTPTGESTYSSKRGRDMLLTFQSLLGKTDSKEDDFRALLTKLAPDEIRGVMLGPYLVGKPAGRGGFATVHVGRELSTGRRVAVKILLDGQDSRCQERFQQEARFLSRIDHPNVVQIFGYGEDTWSAPRSISLSEEEWFKTFSKSAPVKSYIAMEWVEGTTLDEYINPPDERDRVSDRQIAEWFAQATCALSAVHLSGLVHRDLKPSNLMVDDENEVKLMDFGIARSQDKERTLQTATGGAMGTLAYMSPEQIRAANKEAEVGPPTDIYSLCATFYELFTHRRLFAHDTESLEMITTRKLAGERPDRPRLITKSLPWELETILMGGLEAHIEDRYPSMEAVRHDLERYLNDEPIEYKRPSLGRRLQLGYRRNRLVANLTMFFMLIAMAGSAWYVAKIKLALEAQITAVKAKDIALKNEKEALKRQGRAETLRIEADVKRLESDIGLLLGTTNSARVIIEKFDTVADADKPIVGMLLQKLDPQDAQDTLSPRDELRVRLALLRWRHGLGRKQDEQLTDKSLLQPIDDDLLLSESLLSADHLPRLKAAVELRNLAPQKLMLFQELILYVPIQEVVLIRDTIKPQARMFVERFWELIGARRLESSHRIRAACCLAAWDPTNEKWNEIVEQVAAVLVDQAPEEIFEWIGAFAGQHQLLIPHLKVHFRDQTPERHNQRLQAARILVEMIRYDVHEYADLLVDSDSEQFNIVFSGAVAGPHVSTDVDANERIGGLTLEEQAELSHLLSQSIERGPASISDAFPQLDDRWEFPTAEMREVAESGFGLIGDRFAFVCRLPRNEFDDFNSKLNVCGFYLHRYRGSQSHVAAVWKKDGRESKLVVSSFKDFKQTVDAEKDKADGFRVIDAFTFVDELEDGPADRVAGILQRKRPGDAVTRLQLEANHLANQALWVEEDFLPATYQQTKGQYKQHRRAIVRQQWPDNYPRWIRYAPTNLTQILNTQQENWLGFPFHDVCLTKAANGSASGAAPVDAYILGISRNDVVGYLQYGVLDESFLEHSVGGVQRGWEVETISTFDIGEATHVAIIWHQRLLSAEIKTRISIQRANAALAILKLAELSRDQREKLRLMDLHRLDVMERAEIESAEIKSDSVLKEASNLDEFKQKLEGPRNLVASDKPSNNEEPSFESGPNDVKQPDEMPNATPAGVADHLKEEQRSHEEGAWQSLAYSRLPSLRTEMIHRFRPYKLRPITIFNRLKTERDFFIQQALIQALGEYSIDEIGADQMEEIREWLLDAYSYHSDAGVHSSAEWTYSKLFSDTSALNVARQKHKEKGGSFTKDFQDNRDKFVTDEFKKLTDQVTDDKKSGNDALSALAAILGGIPGTGFGGPDKVMATGLPPKNWYVSPSGPTMVLVTPPTVPFKMGAPINTPDWNENEDLLQDQLIAHEYAISSSEITKAQFQRFQVESDIDRRMPLVSKSKIREALRQPMAAVNFYYAAAYCNWLSQQEGLPEREWCYRVGQNSVYIYPDYLLRSGYRLPTEPEWEFACRAGTDSTWYFGENEGRLEKYGWYSKNSNSAIQNVKQLKPNNLGLFDMCGNGAEFCDQVLYRNLKMSIPGCFTGSPGERTSVSDYAIRGGTVRSSPAATRSSGLTPIRVDSKFTTLRVARTWQTHERQISRATEIIENTNNNQLNPGILLRRAISASRVGEYERASADYHQYVHRISNNRGGLYLDGLNAYVEGPHIDFDKLGPFTLEAIVSDWRQTVLAAGDTYGKQSEKRAIWIDSTSAGWVNSSGISAAVQNIPTAQRCHVAIVFDGQFLRTYLNANLSKEMRSAAPSAQDASVKLLIGRTVSGTFNGSGLIESVRLTKGALYRGKQFRLQDIPSNDSNTVLNYQFALDKGQRVIKDRSGNGNDGKLVNAWWLKKE